MAELHDPALPPGAIVATHKEDESLEEGQVRRNDGVVLNPACKNPWYVLATVAGEQPAGGFKTFDQVLHDRNARVWNRHFARKLSPETRKELEASRIVPPTHVSRLTSNDSKQIRRRFRDAFGQDADKILLQLDADDIAFADTYFMQPVYFRGYVFGKYANFANSHFASRSDFNGTVFVGNADFRNHHAQRLSLFAHARFQELAYFHSSTFLGVARFQKAVFEGRTFFEEAKFGKDADFRDAEFADDTTFLRAGFSAKAGFFGGRFSGNTVFEETRFRTLPPEFFDREMHENTRFSDDDRYWPDVTATNEQVGKRAYTRLRKFAASIQDPDLEHFFLRQEMCCKEQIEINKKERFHAWFFGVYRVIADSGISVKRPAVSLALTVAVPWGIIGSWLRANGSETPIAEGFGVSVGNTLPFLGLVRKMHPDFYKEAPWWLDALSGAQSLLGIVLLFFFGLGLRNRFRLK